VLDVGARPGGVGVRDVDAQEETELAVETIEHLRERFDVPLSIDTQRAAVAAAGAAVIATHSRLPPGVPDPAPVYDDVVEDVVAALTDLAARAAGIPAERIVLDPGYDLGKTWQQTLQLLAHTPRFAALGHPLLIAVSNKIFLGRAARPRSGSSDSARR
jgi:dihydropteroate synthase